MPLRKYCSYGSKENYLKKLRLFKYQDLIKVITGVRRCEKSTFLNVFREELLDSGVSADNIPFFNF